MDANDCPGCGGTGCQYEDRFDRYGEHYTVEIECTECPGSNFPVDEDRLERLAERLAIAEDDSEASTEAPC